MRIFARLTSDANQCFDRRHRGPSAPRRRTHRAPPAPGGRRGPEPVDDLGARLDRPPRPGDAERAGGPRARAAPDGHARPRPPGGAPADRARVRPPGPPLLAYQRERRGPDAAAPPALAQGPVPRAPPRRARGRRRRDARARGRHPRADARRGGPPGRAAPGAPRGGGPPVPAALGRSFRSLSVPNYRRYFAGQVVSLSGNWMQTVAEVWLILKLTGDGTLVGLAAGLQFLPVLVAGAWGGLLADRIPKRRLLTVTQALMAIPALALWALTAKGVVAAAIVLALIFVRGCGIAFDNPRRQ